MIAPSFACRAASLAAMLRRAGAPGRPVVAVTASAEALAIAAYASLAVRSPFFPLDPGLPGALAAELIGQIGACLVIGDGRSLSTQAILAAEPGAVLALQLGPGPALMIATSGSSGRPKVVVLTGSALAASSAASMKRTPLRAGERWLACLPLFHIGGFSVLTRCALAGAQALLQQGFDAGRVHRALIEDRVTHVSLTPTMLAQLLALGPAPPSLRHALVGGAALSAELARRAFAEGWPIQPTYGMSETCSQFASLPNLPPDWRPGTVGTPLDGGEAALAADGRLIVRGPMLMHGYANPDLTPGDGLCDGWFVTNDLAEISPEGALTILGRADETIVSGGKKIHPALVENLLAGCPGVEAVFVTGRPDSVWGEIVTAVFSGPLSPEDLLTWCRDHVASAFRPRAAVRLAALPLLANGKPDRVKLRELGGRREPETGAIRQV